MVSVTTCTQENVTAVFDRDGERLRWSYYNKLVRFLWSVWWKFARDNEDKLGVSRPCGYYCWFIRIFLWCWYSSVSCQSFVLRSFVIAHLHNTKKPPMKLNEFWSKWRRLGKITKKKMSPFISLQVLQQFPFSFQFNSLLLEASLSSF